MSCKIFCTFRKDGAAEEDRLTRNFEAELTHAANMCGVGSFLLSCQHRLFTDASRATYFAVEWTA